MQGVKGINHGTMNTYIRHGCRCSECRACNAKVAAKNREKNREYYREAARKSYEKRREITRERAKESYDPVKNKARCAVRYAISTGKLQAEECEVGEDCFGSVQAHHDDYSRQLEVRWLCRRHHALHHYATDMPRKPEGPIATLQR